MNSNGPGLRFGCPVSPDLLLPVLTSGSGEFFPGQRSEGERFQSACPANTVEGDQQIIARQNVRELERSSGASLVSSACRMALLPPSLG
jgi:hypothetical protein